MRHANGGRRRQVVAVVTAMALCLLATATGPQGAHAATRCSQNGSGPVVGDLDGDQRADVVVGVPNLTGSAAEDSVGGVDVHLSGGGRQRVTLDAVNKGGGSERGARFGAAVELGPYFDQDSCSDLVVGAPGLDEGRGAVFVLHGSGLGVATAGSVRIVAPDGAAGDSFGASVATGAGEDGVHLWVGAPGRDVAGRTQAGEVYDYLVGPAFDLRLVGTLNYATAGVPGDPAAGDRFGQVLNGWGSAVMVGVPRRTVHGQAGAGEVVWASRGLDESPTFTAMVVNQDSPSVPGKAERGDHFGAALADGLLDWVGVPGEDLGDIADAGLVHSEFTLNDEGQLGGGHIITQNTPGIPGRAERGDHFGAALATVTGMRCRSTDDLAVGAPGESVGSVPAAGSVTLITERADGEKEPAPPGCAVATVLTQRTRLPGRLAARNHVGATLATLDVNRENAVDHRSGLVVGVPGQDRAVRDAGMVVSLPQLGSRRSYRKIGGDVREQAYGSVLAQLR
jgi:hypothetical protein